MSTFFNRSNFYYLAKELTWLALTAAAAYAILLPITSKMDFIYWKMFAFFIFITLTYFRYSIAFKSIPFFRPAPVRFLVFAFNFSLFIYLMYQEQKFLLLYQNFYTEDFGFPKVIFYDEVKEAVFRHLYFVLTLFGTGSLLMIAAFQCRLILSYWQYYKHRASQLLES